MNYASLNFTMDVALIAISLAFLIRDYPARTAFLTILCIASYLVPIAKIEDAIDPTPLVVEASADPATATTEDSNDPAATARNQVKQLAQGDPSQTARNVTGIWSTVLNGLSNMPGGGGGTVDVAQAVSERSGHVIPGSSSASSDTAIGQRMSSLERSLLDGRFGNHVLRPREVVLVDQFWFFARCCLLAGAAYFLLFDWKITMSIVSLCVIPVHYYMVLFIFLGTNWKKTEPWWGTMRIMGIVLAGLVLLAIIGRQILLHTDKHSFHIPNPENYRARLGGIEYDYIIMGNSIELAGITLDLATSYLDKKNHTLLRFQSGAAIEFVKRKTV